MSGGHFDYQQYHITYIADEVEQLIRTNEDEGLNEWGDKRGRFYRKEVIGEFTNGLNLLRMAAIYAQRIDWLVSDDDGENEFLERLQEDLGKEIDGLQRKRKRRLGAG